MDGEPSASSARHPSSSMLSSQKNTTCDRCRKRKVKCVTLPPDIPDNEDQKCKGCYNLDEPCTYEYVVKRAGRKTTRVINQLKKSRESANNDKDKDKDRDRDLSFSHPEAGPSSSRRPTNSSPPSQSHLQRRPSHLQNQPQPQHVHPHNNHTNTNAHTHAVSPEETSTTSSFQFSSGLMLPHHHQASPPPHSHSHSHHAHSISDLVSRPLSAGLGIGPGVGVGVGVGVGSAGVGVGHNGAGGAGIGYHQEMDMDIDMRGPGPAGLGISSSYYDPTNTNNNNNNNNNVSVNTPLPYGGGGHGGGDMHTSALSVSTSSQPDDQAALSGLLHLRNHIPGSAEGYPHSQQGQGQAHGVQGQNPYQQNQHHNQHQQQHPHQNQNQNQHHPPSASSYHYVVPDFPHSLTGNHTRQSHSHSQVLQLEQVISWANAAFFLRLYLKYQHALMPLVHKPTFAKDIVDRRDKTDEVFRGLLFSLITHVISQVPKSKMITHFTQPDLERLQVRCHQASRTIQVKYHHEPSLELIIAHYADVAVCTTLGKTELSGIILAEAVRMSYSLGLHRPKSVLGGDFLQTQMQRRLFWILYQTDKTEASVGLPSLMPDYEGVPPMPLEVDDEFITPQGYLPQPANRPSTMTGLAMSCRLFRIFSECLFRHRTFSYTPGVAADPDSTLNWVDGARMDLRETVLGMPTAWQAHPEGMEDEDDRVMYGTQRANILITAASLDFALLDLKALIVPELDIAEEREAAARDSYRVLSAIPIEHLAMNGESIRGKVLRIIIALMSTTSMQDETYNQSVKDWWGILSQVQWVQVIPLDTESLLSTESQSM